MYFFLLLGSPIFSYFSYISLIDDFIYFFFPMDGESICQLMGSQRFGCFAFKRQFVLLV